MQYNKYNIQLQDLQNFLTRRLKLSLSWNQFVLTIYPPLEI